MCFQRGTEFRSGDCVQHLVAPCILPELEDIQRLEVAGPRYESYSLDIEGKEQDAAVLLSLELPATQAVPSRYAKDVATPLPRFPGDAPWQQLQLPARLHHGVVLWCSRRSEYPSYEEDPHALLSRPKPAKAAQSLEEKTLSLAGDIIHRNIGTKESTATAASALAALCSPNDAAVDRLKSPNPGRSRTHTRIAARLKQKRSDAKDKGPSQGSLPAWLPKSFRDSLTLAAAPLIDVSLLSLVLLQFHRPLHCNCTISFDWALFATEHCAVVIGRSIGAA